MKFKLGRYCCWGLLLFGANVSLLGGTPPQEFRDFLSSPPPIERLVVQVDYKDTKRPTAFLFIRWQAGDYLYREENSLQALYSSSLTDGSRYIGSFQGMLWHQNANSLNYSTISTNAVKNPVLGISQAAFITLSQVMSMGMTKILVGTAEWEEGRLQAKVYDSLRQTWGGAWVDAEWVSSYGHLSEGMLLRYSDEVRLHVRYQMSQTWAIPNLPEKMWITPIQIAKGWTNDNNLTVKILELKPAQQVLVEDDFQPGALMGKNLPQDGYRFSQGSMSYIKDGEALFQIDATKTKKAPTKASKTWALWWIVLSVVSLIMISLIHSKFTSPKEKHHETK